MVELTEFEICKKIAKIELADDFIGMQQHAHDGICINKKEYGLIFRVAYNPLTDDALCFRFCHQGNISVSYTECPAGTGKAYYASKDGNTTDYQATPNMAVCLAKIGIFEVANNE